MSLQKSHRRVFQSRLEKAIAEAEASSLACCACAEPLKLALGGWSMDCGRWMHFCSGKRHPAVPRRLFDEGILRPLSPEEKKHEAQAA